MKRFFLYLGATILVLALVGYVVLQFFLGSIVKAGVNRLGPVVTQTPVSLAAAHISPLSGEGTLTGFRVGNPKGWSDRNAFSFATIHIDVEPRSLFGDHIVVNAIEIDQPEFNYETKVVSSNIGDLMANIEGQGQQGGTTAAGNGRPLKFEVKKFVLRNGKVTLGVGPAAVTLPMPPITLENLGTSQGGITSGQLASAVIRSISSSVLSATAQGATQIGKTSGAAAAEGVKKAGEAIRGLFGGKK